MCRDYREQLFLANTGPYAAVSLPLLLEDQMKLHTQGLSKPYDTNYTATTRKDKMSEQRLARAYGAGYYRTKLLLRFAVGLFFLQRLERVDAVFEPKQP